MTNRVYGEHHTYKQVVLLAGIVQMLPVVGQHTSKSAEEHSQVSKKRRSRQSELEMKDYQPLHLHVSMNIKSRICLLCSGHPHFH